MSFFFAFSTESRCAACAAFSIAEDMKIALRAASRSRVFSDSACSASSAGSTSPYSFCRAGSRGDPRRELLLVLLLLREDPALHEALEHALAVRERSC